MNITQALKVAHNILGARAQIYEDRTAPDGETRRAQATRKRELKEAAEAARQAMIARRNALLNADAEYVQLRDAYEAACDAAQRAPYGMRYRYSIGDETLGIRTVSAQGDTLAEAVQVLEARARKTS